MCAKRKSIKIQKSPRTQRTAYTAHSAVELIIVGYGRTFESDEEMLATAIEHMNRLFFIGISDEHYELSRQMIGYMLGVKGNAEPILDPLDGLSFFELDEEAIELVKQTNALDLALYEIALRQFEQRVKFMKSCSGFVIDQ
jgi:hypothetical protein